VKFIRVQEWDPWDPFGSAYHAFGRCDQSLQEV